MNCGLTVRLNEHASASRLLPHTTCALPRRLRAKRLPLQEHDVDLALGQLIGKRASADAASDDYNVSAFHSRTFPRTRR